MAEQTSLSYAEMVRDVGLLVGKIQEFTSKYGVVVSGLKLKDTWGESDWGRVRIALSFNLDKLHECISK
jgi:hypothetical protein